MYCETTLSDIERKAKILMYFDAPVNLARPPYCNKATKGSDLSKQTLMHFPAMDQSE